MHESLLNGHGPNDNSHSGYLKVEEGKNNWVEYWVAIRDNRILLYSDECSEESGEEAMKSIELSSETRCELLQRRNYHFRFKLVVGGNSLYKLKCSSAFHRQQWISQIMLASSKDRVVELNVPRESNRTRTLSSESQLSSDAESLHESELESSGAFSDGGTSVGRLNTPDLETESSAKPIDRREAKGLLRRLSFKASNRLRRNSNSSPRGELSDTGSPSPLSPAMRQVGSPKTESPVSSPKVDKGIVDFNKVFVNPAFVPSPSSSPAITRKTDILQEVDLIDIS
ncbi:uncharacterized protein LOC114535970 [Dendronephthya gigantea]|uniref:uncharacterized protein LOC114535970 n=1 Tax=Dendronephthya gigantea TaxID=151771 RepID=UPI00106A17E1|nr:uncharacterized protein LOC114535970 [Dendronephthya gigantea]